MVCEYSEIALFNGDAETLTHFFLKCHTLSVFIDSFWRKPSLLSTVNNLVDVAVTNNLLRSVENGRKSSSFLEAWYYNLSHQNRNERGNMP